MTSVSIADEETAESNLNNLTRQLVSDLHTPRASVFWADLCASAALGWGAFAVAVARDPWTGPMLAACVVSGLALYRGLCFTHELTHLRRRSVRGFETAWNVLFGVPLLLPSFTYIGVHQSHHSLATYGTKDDPEYLPFASSRRLIVSFSVQSSVLIPLLLLVRFLVLAPIGLVWPRFHRWLETYASSFSMNPRYRRSVSGPMAKTMRVWEVVVIACWACASTVLYQQGLLGKTMTVWAVVLGLVSFVNTMRVLGAHEYETDGSPRDRFEQLRDSIDTPGGPWTELWAPVGLRYHALHHYFPGIPYHNLGKAYRRILAALPPDSPYLESTSPSLRRSLTNLFAKAKARGAAVLGW